MTLYEEDKPAKQDTRPRAGKTETAKTATLLDQLKEAIKKKVERPIVHLDVPERPGVKIIISPNITQQQLRQWRRNAGEETKAGLDALKFACAVVAHTTRGIVMNGDEVRDENGFEITFASPVILDMTETERPHPDAVRAFFGVDPHVESAALAILEASGYSDTVDTEDPTKESSNN
jgi:hypothetical protein